MKNLSFSRFVLTAFAALSVCVSTGFVAGCDASKTEPATDGSEKAAPAGAQPRSGEALVEDKLKANQSGKKLR